MNDINPSVGRENRISNCFGPVPDLAIDKAENQLGVTFPPGYRRFLQQYGAAWLEGPDSLAIAGVTTERRDDVNPPTWESVVAATLSSRNGNPRSLLFISGDGGDVSYCLDTSALDPSGECQVVALGPGHDCVVIAGSFDEFIELAATGRLANSA